MFIGMLSGTSMDAVDCALVDFTGEQPNMVDFLCCEIPIHLKQQLATLINNQGIDLRALGNADVLLGKLFAETAQQIIKRNGLKPSAVAAIGSHGQTIWHQPQASEQTARFTLQIGDPNTIAHLTGITTIADFRRHDMSAGGQGAPLVPALHQALFRSTSTPRIVLNLGGIANITVLPTTPASPFGYDTGPANILLDSWIQHSKTVPFDENGDWAETGNVQPELLDTLLDEQYFSMQHPKSTGRELFNLHWLQKKLAVSSKQYQAEDVQATLLELTTTSISQAIQRHLSSGEVLACGGGVRNNALMRNLQKKLPGFRVGSTEEHGLHPDSVEAVAFAWFAKQTLAGTPIDFSPFTGAEKAVIAGGIYQA
ncbi:MAG: anhydro-N-acetylmuramic acid kinase [Pseudomonadota bacterium]